ncbi:hypothetical protein [Octadecabacter antarcticus]|uniref:hypothetical protein n=1 Tax=Octadecabacter antarcticus TaxID=1217908 RepID=UPI0001806701|nr:hypothetical protein [Octadecabacter antarcticus]
MLQGVMCRVELRDGIAAEVVLHPDFSPLLLIFDRVWSLLKQSLKTVDDIGEFWEGDYVLGLFPEMSQSGRPILAYADALALKDSLSDFGKVKTVEITHVLEPLARIIESMAAVGAIRLGLSTQTAAMFGKQLAYVASGVATGTIDAFARGSLLDASGEIGWCRDQPWADETWIAAQPSIENIHDRCLVWDKKPGLLAKQRQLWYQARRFETRACKERS